MTLDAFVVSLQRGADFFDLLLVDELGALADPFGTAPGTTILGPAVDPDFDLVFGADLSSLAGDNVTLLFDVIQEDDGFQFDLHGDNIEMTSSPPTSKIIPEPSALLIWILLGVTCIGTSLNGRAFSWGARPWSRKA